MHPVVIAVMEKILPVRGCPGLRAFYQHLATALDWRLSGNFVSERTDELRPLDCRGSAYIQRLTPGAVIGGKFLHPQSSAASRPCVSAPMAAA